MINIVSPFGDGFGFSMKISSDYPNVTLYSKEMELLSPNVVQKRRIEFCLGRAAAHSALQEINVCNFPVLKGVNREPLWPQGIVGAISHCDGIALAAVTAKDKAAGIGLDIEQIKPTIEEGIAKHVCTMRELEWINQKSEQKIKRMLMIFSAKESIFKAFFPITGIFLDFMDAELTWNENSMSFSGKLLKPAGQDYGKGYALEVGCRTDDNYIFTFIQLPPAGSCTI